MSVTMSPAVICLKSEQTRKDENDADDDEQKLPETEKAHHWSLQVPVRLGNESYRPLLKEKPHVCFTKKNYF